MNISEYLMTGEKNAQSSKELCTLLHIDLRALQASIERERRNGVPICAVSSTDRKGYFLAENKREMLDYCQFLKRRKDSVQETLAACIKTVDKLPDV